MDVVKFEDIVDYIEERLEEEDLFMERKYIELILDLELEFLYEMGLITQEGE